MKKEIYAIQHNKTKRIFIGQSENAGLVIKNRILRLRKNNDSCESMQKEFNEFGEDYSFFILETYDNYRDGNRLSMWLYKYPAEQLYNAPPKKASIVVKFSEGVPK